MHERVVFQSTRNGCGPASLTMVLQSLGIACALDSVQAMFQLQPAGASVSEIIRVADLFDVSAAGWRVRPEELTRKRPPLIAFIDNDHFVVLDSIRGSLLYMRDPSRGSHVIHVEEFFRQWDGIVVEFERKNGPP